MRLPVNYGIRYAAEFQRVYEAVAKQRGAALMPFFLDGVGGDPRLNQTDGIHPTAEGYRLIVDRLWPYFRPLLVRLGSLRRARLASMSVRAYHVCVARPESPVRGGLMTIKAENFSLDAKYTLERGRIYLRGIQALVRLPLDQHRADRRRGLHTATFVSGYRGSPLGGLDQTLERYGKLLREHDVVFSSGLNEDLAATAVFGSQMVGLFPNPKYDGVLGMWYGKAPGVDRTGDAFKHANYAGVGQERRCPRARRATTPSPSPRRCRATPRSRSTTRSCPRSSPATSRRSSTSGSTASCCSRVSGLWVGDEDRHQRRRRGGHGEVDPDRVAPRDSRRWSSTASRSSTRST